MTHTANMNNCESRVANRVLNGNSDDVAVTTRAASVSASGTPAGGNGKTQDGNRPNEFQISNCKLQIEQQKQQKQIQKKEKETHGQDARATHGRDAHATNSGTMWGK